MVPGTALGGDRCGRVNPRRSTEVVLGLALAVTAVPVAAAALSGGVAAVRSPGPRLTSALQHFAAGVVFAAAAIELLPGVLAQSPRVAIIGFAVGVVVMFGFRFVSERVEHQREVRGQAGLPIGFAAATAVDFFIDGVILGAGFTAGSTVGVLLAIALAVEYLFVGLSLSATLTGLVPRWLVAAAPVILALLTVAGTVLGVLLLDGASSTVLAGVLAFGVVAFMYLATEELLVEAHAKGETSLGSVGYFVGFLLYLVLAELIR